MNPIRIAFLSYDFPEYCIQHANGLLANGEVMLILPQNLFEPYADSLDPNVTLRTFTKPRLRQALSQLARIRWIFRQLREFKPDVVHFQLGHMWMNLALPLIRRYPLVFTIHDPRCHDGDRGSKKTPQRVMDFGYRRADQIIVHGSQLRQSVVNEVGISPERVHVVPHIAIGGGESTEAHKPEPNRILFFGRIWKYKGLEYLIRSQPHVNRIFPDAKFVICGRGEDFDSYRKMMHDPDRFEIHNRWITDDQRIEQFQRASMVVLPYTEATQSGVVPVAYAHSKPVIATRTGGLPEIVDHDRSGLLVPPRDAVALADAITQLLRDPNKANAMGNAGRKKWLTDLSPESVTAKTAQVYRAAIESRRTNKKTKESRFASTTMPNSEISN